MTSTRDDNSSMPRRKFLEVSATTLGGVGIAAVGAQSAELTGTSSPPPEGPPAVVLPRKRPYNEEYSGPHLNRVFSAPEGLLG